MSYYNTHKIATNYHGHVYNVNYWPEGYGVEATGYATDFNQFRANIADQIEKSDIAFMIITTDGKPKHITNTNDLRAAVEHLDDETVLSVQALDKPQKGGKGKGKNKRKKNIDYESDDEDESWKAKTVKNLKAEKNDKKVLAIVYRFVTHSGECHHCSNPDWSGRRYTYEDAPSYGMCGTCYDELDDDYKEYWNNGALPWEGDAPEAPLGDDYEESEEVKHLQYLLTRLGHMKLDDTASLIGSYRDKTESAVASFRKKHNIKGGDPTMYDKKTATKLAQIVKKLREEGHKYL